MFGRLSLQQTNIQKTMGRLIIFLAILLAMLLLSCTSQKIKNGVYEGRSQAMYTNEPYVGIARIAFKKEKIADFGFQIIDTSKNEIFDSKYERHFADNEKYQQQCRNDWNGVQKYTEQFR